MKKRFYLVATDKKQLKALIPYEDEACIFTEFESPYYPALQRMQRGGFSLPKWAYDKKLILVRNLEQLAVLRDMGYSGKSLVLDSSFHILNHLAHKSFSTLCGWGYSFIASYELMIRELSSLYRSLSPEERKGMILPLYGYIPLMVSAGCIKESKKNCDKICGTEYITDRRGVGFPVKNNCKDCISTIFNSVPYSGHQLLVRDDIFPEASYKLEFSVEDHDTVEKILKFFLIPQRAKAGEKPDFSYTTGHLKRKTE